MATLGVNIDHIAVLREARKINDPDPIQALGIAQRAGADQITIHLREDRRHIHDDDARYIVALSPLPVNMECSINEEIIDIVCALKPHRATLVPEKREEVTTEGGLDLHRYETPLRHAIEKLHRHEIEVSLFIDPTPAMLERAKALDATWIELHTGTYANLFAMRYTNLPATRHAIKTFDWPREKLAHAHNKALQTLREAAHHGHSLGLRVAAGHGLNYHNITPVAAIEAIEEFNIGQSIIARSLFVGLHEAIAQMVALVR